MGTEHSDKYWKLSKNSNIWVKSKDSNRWNTSMEKPNIPSLSGAATHLIIFGLPETGVKNEIITTFTVEARMIDSTLDLNYTGDVTMSIISGSGNLLGTVTKGCVAGIAIFDDLYVDNDGDFTFQASSGSLTPDTDTITIELGVPEKFSPEMWWDAADADSFSLSGSSVDSWANKGSLGGQMNYYSGTKPQRQLSGGYYGVFFGNYLNTRVLRSNINYTYNPQVNPYTHVLCCQVFHNDPLYQYIIGLDVNVNGVFRVVGSWGQVQDIMMGSYPNDRIINLNGYFGSSRVFGVTTYNDYNVNHTGRLVMGIRGNLTQYPFGGYIFEYLRIPGTLNSSQITEIDNYMSAKYGATDRSIAV